MMSAEINPNIYYAGIVILAICALAGTYLHVLPDSQAFTAIVGFLIGHSVTIVSSQVVLRGNTHSNGEQSDKSQPNT